MWLFHKNGFLSIVEHKDDSSLLMVRARDKVDIESCVELLKSLDPDVDYEIKRTPQNDYLYRIVVPKVVMAEVAKNIVLNIGYTNFKGEIHTQRDPERDYTYGKVWQAMFEFQEYRAF